MSWEKTQKVICREYKCGYCDNIVASDDGYFNDPFNVILICPHCNKPTYLNETTSTQVPGVSIGNKVDNIPQDVEVLYNESRRINSVGGYTSSVLTCRKLLMNIAVNLGAQPGQTFISYVEYLANNGYVPPNGKGWVDHIRLKGNEATHEIAIMTQDDAEDLITFTEMLLKFIYEFPGKIKPITTTP
jgi:hypothetical protein